MASSLILSEMWIYPVKSLAGITIQNGFIENRGLRWDRRWVIIDEQGKALSQRQFPKMATITQILNDHHIILRDHVQHELRVPQIPQTSEVVTVEIWGDKVEAVLVSKTCDEWLSNALGAPVRLAFMTDTSSRLVDADYAPEDTQVSFSDGFPYLIAGKASLDDLNARLPSPVKMQRFRPNFIFEGGLPYEEDHWYEFRIGRITFLALKPCARCVMTTVNPNLGEIDSAEPLRTLASYRKVNNRIFFGQNVLTYQTGIVSVGDKIRVISRRQRQTMS
ncbi:MAG: MOSC domain-containing protein [Runella sp.]